MLVYSVSVLEHTTDPIAIVDELCRVLKPGGTLVLTFDIGLDGVSWLAPQEAQGVLDHLARCFDRERVDLRHDLGTPDVLTSDVVGKMDRNLLPWVSPFLSLVLTSVRRRKFPARLRKKLAFYCGTYSSPAGGVQTRHGD
ncbi:MAG: methyltransferase domain-containing protein [Gammaproteobacteria bacterium]